MVSFFEYPHSGQVMVDSSMGLVTNEETPNVQIEGQPASGLSLSNAGLGWMRDCKTWPCGFPDRTIQEAAASCNYIAWNNKYKIK